MNTLTLQNIKDQYYFDVSRNYEPRGFESYLKENYVQVYDVQLNFLGYDKK